MLHGLKSVVSMTDNIIIRPASPADLADINVIFNYYVAHSTCVWTTTPCSEAERKAWYEGRSEAMPVLVAECSGHIVGWGALSSFRTAYTLAGTLEDSVYVHHDFHRRGIGSRLLTELIDAARQKGLRSILANISADQSPSIRLHEKFGFRQVAHLQQVGQKFNQWFDAVYLQLLLAANKSLQATAAAPASCD
jgi:L-amino acid N-acyltransferase YncA